MNGTWRRALRVGGGGPARTGAEGPGAVWVRTATVNGLASVPA